LWENVIIEYFLVVKTEILVLEEMVAMVVMVVQETRIICLELTCLAMEVQEEKEEMEILKERMEIMVRFYRSNIFKGDKNILNIRRKSI
ncbi:MAG: hypothetical protein K2K15_03540, partial [Anaeroplasmataceae bacterium]|nr:hypothetical protein [Anaeroplasmataceae bacterium]